MGALLVIAFSTAAQTTYVNNRGFWLFLASGTILGGVTTMLADGAAEDSCFRAIWHIVLCKRCCRKKDDKDDRGEPLIQDEYA